LPDNAEQVRRKKIWLEVVTPTKQELRKEVEYVVVPTIDGVVGILPGHIRLMSLVATGVLRYKIDGVNYLMAVSQGYLEVTPHKVIVLAEAAELSENIDVEQALKEKREAEAALQKSLKDRVSSLTAMTNLERAVVMLQVAKKSGEGSKKDEAEGNS
jgi:F-type H+-transporting ATPase subunit epsilon